MAERVLEGFADDVSRAHHLAFAAYRLAREEWSFVGAPVTPGDRFFIAEALAALRPGERILDGGAHHGELLPRFFAACAGRPDRLFAVEPDPASLAAIDAARAGWPREVTERVSVVDAVLADRAGPVRFHAGLGYASQIAPTGAAEREATTIDALDVRPTIVKLHLEGGELAALKGAAATIARHRPILMLTTYHDAAGLVETPLYLMTALEDYAVFMRAHGFCGTGTVLYAIPKERMSR
nr:FkbM family methyltransferase [Jiella sonneratiae]